MGGMENLVNGEQQQHVEMRYATTPAVFARSGKKIRLSFVSIDGAYHELITLWIISKKLQIGCMIGFGPALVGVEIGSKTYHYSYAHKIVLVLYRSILRPNNKAVSDQIEVDLSSQYSCKNQRDSFYNFQI